jgi:hypothetical protein
MRRSLVIMVGMLMTGAPQATFAVESCGDSGILCGDEEKCCEHLTAYYSEGGVQGASTVEGQCVPKAQKCGEFWCGPKHCQASIWGSQTVCCIDPGTGGMPDYQCARNELSCPGNAQLLSIRSPSTTQERSLKGS